MVSSRFNSITGQIIQGAFTTNKIFLLFLLMILTLTGCNFDFDRREKIIIGIDDEFAPMTFRDINDELVGFDIDLAEEAMKRLGVSAEFKSIDWNNKEAEITSGNVDMVWSGCDITEKYKEYMIFSKSYMENRQIILIKNGKDFNINSEYDLAGLIVGTQAGSYSETYVEGNLKLKNSLRDLKTYSSYRNGFNALDDGEIDALIVDEIAGRYEMNKNPGKFETFEVTVGPFTEFAMGFSKDNVELHDKTQKVFDEMIKDGTAQKISKKWFQADLIKSHSR